MPAVARLFGTDGVRGVANRDLTPELVFALGRAVVAALGGEGRPRIAIGRDTRVSGPMLQAALSAGICSAGADVLRLGIVPTPAVAYLTVLLNAEAGAMISASHNPPEDNGIKFFSAEGFKLPDEVEDSIERTMRDDSAPRAEGDDVGRVGDAPEAVERYVDHLVAAAEARLDGMRVVVDCANGAAFRLGPQVLERLGAEVEPIHAEGNGAAINVKSGATAPELLARAVGEKGADAGVAFDGDADRAIFADSAGHVIDGDHVIAASALAMHEQGRLPGDRVVVTVMANLGLRRAMQRSGIEVVETQVGDRYVLEEMRRLGATLGGEQSGHVVFLDHATTGDGLLTAVRFLSLARRKGTSVGELTSMLHRFPQVLENVPSADARAVAEGSELAGAVRRAEEALGERGRVLVRASGTEPVVRIMVEAETEDQARRHAEAIAEVARSAS
ncbi:MAG: phosphoglucosamine mutase [Actinomycetota bacterium]